MTTPFDPNQVITTPGQVNVPQYNPPYKRPTSLSAGLGATERLAAKQQQAVSEYQTQYQQYSQRIDDANKSVADYNKALELYAKQKTPGKVLGFLPDFIEMPLEKLGSGLYWTYSKFVSQPVSFALLYTRESFHYALSGGQDDPMTSRQIWNQARHFSPGQSFTMLFATDNFLNSKGIDMNDVNAGLHDQEMFNSGWAKYFSGTVDFAASWYLDPVVIGLRGVSKARVTTTVKPTAKIKDFENNSTLIRMTEHVEKMRTKYGDDKLPRQLRKNFVSVARSASGDDLATALAMAKGSDQVADVLRVASGDRSVLTKLESENQLAASAVQASQRRLSIIGSAYAQNPNPAFQQAYKAVLADHSRQLTNMENQLGYAAAANKAQDSLDALNYNRFLTPMGQQFRSWVDDLPRYGKSGSTGNIPTAGLFGRTLRYSFYTAPVSVFQLPFRAGRAWFDIAPPRYIAFDHPDSWRRVDAQLRNVKSMPKELKDSLVSDYIKAKPETRGNVLMDIEAVTVHSIAKRYNMADDEARELFQSYNKAYENKVTNSYSNGRIEDPNNPGNTIRADEISDSNGHVEKVVPIDPTQLQSTKIMTDFAQMESVIKNSGSAIGRMIRGSKHIAGAIDERAMVLNRYWKVSNLVSMRYAIRSISDDLLGQVARQGAMAMVGRTGGGVRNLANGLTRGTWRKGVQQGDEMRMALARRELDDLNANKAHYEDLVKQWPTQANMDTLARINENIDDVTVGIGKMQQRMAVRAGDRPVMAALGDRVEVMPSAFDGTSGAMFQREVANANSHQEMLGSTAGRTKRMHGTGSFTDIRFSDNPELAMQSWHRVLTRQYANSAGWSSILREGMNERDFVRWMQSNPEGQNYWRTMQSQYGANTMNMGDHAQRVFADMDEVLPLTMPGRGEVVDAVLSGNSREVAKRLKDVPEQYRPLSIRSELENGPAGVNAVARDIDKAIDGFYRIANELPANILSKSPLFASLYREHVNDLIKAADTQGVTHLGVEEKYRMAEVARKRALRDVKNLSFNLDHEQRLAHAMRFFVPFGASFQESMNRWFRIIRDKPQTAAHAANLFNSPTRAGWTVDQNGDKIGPDGYVTDRVTGQRRLVPLDERNMVMQIPDWAQPMMEKIVGTPLTDIPVPMTSIIPTVQNYPVWNPGFGPIVQIPASKFLDNSPTMHESLKELGLMPFQGRGVTSGPAWLGEASRAIFDTDTSSGYENDVLAVIRKMQYDYESGKRNSPPSVEEARGMARKMAGLKAIQKFFLPFGGTPERGIEVADGQDINYKPISFFVKRYQEAVRDDPINGLDKFLDKYGDSYFAFTQALTKANSTVPATTGGAAVMSEYSELLKSVDPDLGGLIAGPEGKGPFSQQTYAYQLETPTMNGENMREKLTPEQMISEMNRKKGWYEYNKAMLQAQADLFDAGFQSFQDRGAEYFAALKQNIVNMMTMPRLQNGMPNPHYNREWEQDYSTQDRGFYDRRASDMESIVKYFEVKDAIESRNDYDQPTVVRSDIYGLRQYLANRRQVTTALDQRKGAGGSDDINAKANEDIKFAFTQATVDLIEKYIPFAELHNRYLSRDMGIDIFTR